MKKTKKKVSKKKKVVKKKKEMKLSFDVFELLLAHYDRASKQPTEKFVGATYICNKCKTLLRSTYEGMFSSCPCGNFVDQTKYYVRCGGDVELYKGNKGDRE